MLATLLAVSALAAPPATITVTTTRFVTMQDQIFMGIERKSFVEKSLRWEGTDSFRHGHRTVSSTNEGIEILSFTINPEETSGVIQRSTIDKSGVPDVKRFELDESDPNGMTKIFEALGIEDVNSLFSGDVEANIKERLSNYKSETIKVDRFKDILGVRCQLEIRTSTVDDNTWEIMSWKPVDMKVTGQFGQEVFEETQYWLDGNERTLVGYKRMLSFDTKTVATPKDWPHIVEDDYVTSLTKKLSSN